MSPNPCISPRPHIAAMAAYALADLSVAPGRRLVSLAQNESASTPSPRAIAAATAALSSARLYCDPDWTALRAAIADIHGMRPESILVGAGSMELIAALATAYLDPGDRALTTGHAYLYFRTVAQVAAAEIDVAPETDLHVDIDRLIEAIRPETKLIFVANPGNPTGTRISRAEILALREAAPPTALLILDEAYGEFADGLDEPMFDLVERGDTAVLRTFSKAYGLAGMRVGWGCFPEAVARELRKVISSFSVGGPAQAAAEAAMRDQAHMRACVAETAARREAFAERMRRLGLTPPPSYANFLLLPFASAEQAQAAEAVLRAEGVLMRPVAGYSLPHCLRATIGSDSDMDLAADLLAAFVKGAPS